MFGRRFYIQMELEIHAITSPGVWLCCSGGVELTIRTLGYHFSTTTKPSRLPIIYHESFHINGYFLSVKTLHQLESVLRSQPIDISMLQSGKRLAHFTGKLDAFLGVEHLFLDIGRTNVVDSYVTMTPSKCYPGIIGPRIEYTTRIRIPAIHPEDDCESGSYSMVDGHREEFRKFSTPNEFFRQSYHKFHHHRSVSEPRLHQKPVCHYNPSIFGYNSKGKSKSVKGGERYLNEFDESQPHQYTQQQKVHEQRQHYLFSSSAQQLNEMESGCDTPTPIKNRLQQLRRSTTPIMLSDSRTSTTPKPFHPTFTPSSPSSLLLPQPGAAAVKSSTGKINFQQLKPNNKICSEYIQNQHHHNHHQHPPTNFLNLNQYNEAGRGDGQKYRPKFSEVYLFHSKNCEICLKYQKYFDLDFG